MKRSNAARGIFWLTVTLAIGFLMQAESGDRRTSMPQIKSAPPGAIRVLDQNGQPAVNGVPSATSTIFDVMVGPGFSFSPSTVNISVGDTVRWTWAGSGHSVTSGLPCAADSQYCSPNDVNCASGILSNQGTVYQHTFAQPGTYSYFCASHCVLGMTGVVNVSGGCAPSGWSPGPNLPSVGVGLVGVYFQASGKFYGMGGRGSDVAGNEFTHPFEYDPGSNSWTTKSATYPDTHVNNMACGVLADAGTPYIYCVGGSQVAVTGTIDRVFRYDPVTDVISSVAAPWPGGLGMVLPGGFTVFNNKLYILGGFDTISGGGQGTNQIWEFTPPATWVQKAAVLPVPRGNIPSTTIGNLIYTGGGSDISGGVLTDTTNSFVYNPVGDSISSIASIPRATGETRALSFNGLMLVMGGGRTAPNPSNEVNIYNPANNTWTVGAPVPSFFTARRNFPTDTDGTTRIWLAGGYAPTTATSTMEIFGQCRTLVTTVDDHNDGVCDAADCTLREAITVANASGGSNIAFAPGVTGTIQLATALPSLNTNMAIQGPGANQLTVRRNIGGNYRIFNISANNVTISGLTIANGNSPSNGGGISITGGLTIANCAISGHTTGSSGGGIVSSGTLSIVNSTISGNSATGGFGGGIYSTGTAQITNSTISNNSVSELSLGIGSGGGILNGGGSLVVTNSTISGNVAQFRGGGIQSNSGTLTSRNTIIALNTAPSGPDVFGTLTSDNFNLIGNNSGVTITPAQLSDQIGTAGSPINPLLGPLQNNGGPTLTRALLPGSPAVDKGHSSGLTTDQRGVGFPRTADYSSVTNATGGDGTDIGAVEFWTLKITSITHLSNGHAVLHGIGIPSHLHTIEASPDLSPNSFTAIPPGVTADSNGVLQYDDAGAVGLTKRFYRLSFP